MKGLKREYCFDSYSDKVVVAGLCTYKTKIQVINNIKLELNW